MVSSDVISKVKPSFGRTDLATSLDFVHKYGFDMTQADDTSNILLVFTDGYSNLNKKNTAQMVDTIQLQILIDEFLLFKAYTAKPNNEVIY